MKMTGPREPCQPGSSSRPGSRPAAALCNSDSLKTGNMCVVLRQILTRGNGLPFGKPEKIKPHSPTFLPQYYLGTFPCRFFFFFHIHLAHGCSVDTIQFSVPPTTASAYQESPGQWSLPQPSSHPGETDPFLCACTSL